jgi:hypothetical protein
MKSCTRIHLHGTGKIPTGSCKMAASLHCHTHFSNEILTFIPFYASRVPIVADHFKRALERYQQVHGAELDFSRAWWTPPVTPREVIDIETSQIEQRLGMPAMVSITDHDDIEAGLLLQVLDTPQRHPISMEWTVPFGGGFFHLGVHNLPREEATEIAGELLKYTRQEAGARGLAELLDLLNQSPSTLVVLNHPFWDIELIGEEEHRRCLHEFIVTHGGQLHALEVNGFRRWRENELTISLAAEIGLPVVSGGDRHGCQPNTLLNLTRASNFEEMVAEIRDDRHSEIVVMPEYRESMVMRIFEIVAEVIGHYPDHSLGRPHWSDRVFFTLDSSNEAISESVARPLSHYWPNGGPVWVRSSLWLLRRLGSKQVKAAFRLARAPERVGFEYES